MSVHHAHRSKWRVINVLITLIIMGPSWKELRELREELDLHQEQVAQACGLTQSTFSRLELGQSLRGGFIARQRVSDYLQQCLREQQWAYDRSLVQGLGC